MKWEAFDRSQIGLITSITLSGLGIGWLVGLSVSPVISVVITSVIDLVTAHLPTDDKRPTSISWSAF